MRILELTLLAMLTHISFGGVRVNLSLAAIDSGATPLVIGALLSVFALIPTVLALVGGRWIDRIGVRRPLFIGAAVIGVGALIGWPWLDLRLLFMTSALVGSGFLLTQLVMQKLTGDLSEDPAQRRRNFTWLAIGYSLSGIIGPASTGWLVDSVGHQQTFLYLAALAAVVLLWLLVRRQRLPPPAVAIPVQRRFSDLLRSPELRRLYLAVGLISTAWDVHQFVVPIYGRSIGFSATEIGLVLAAFGAATLVVRLLVPLLTGLTEWRALLMAQAIAAVVYSVYPAFTEFAILVGLSFALGLGLGIAQPMALSLLHKLTPPGRIGEAAGLRMMIVNGTQTLLPTVFGVLGSVFGVGLLFWTVGGMVGAGAIKLGRARYNEDE